MVTRSMQILRFGRLIQVAKLAKAEIVTKDTEARVCLSGLGPHEGDTVTVEDFPGLVDLFTVTRHKAWDAGFLEMAHLRRAGHTFICTQRYRIHPYCESVNSPIELTAKAPDTATNCSDAALTQRSWCIEMALLYVGDTSFITSAALCSPTQTLVDSITTWVYVDRETRRKAHLPDWFRSRFAMPDATVRPERVELPPLGKAQSAALKTHVICEEHVDHFAHTNHSHYASCSVESLLGALGQESSVGERTAWPVARVDMVFSGESREGDRLRVHTAAVRSENERLDRFLCHIQNAACGEDVARVQYDIANQLSLRSAL